MREAVDPPCSATVPECVCLSIYLFTRDEHVITTIHEIDASVIVRTAPIRHLSAGDLCIWDLDFMPRVPSQLFDSEEGLRVILLCTHNGLNAVEPALLAKNHTVVKPIDPQVFRTVLDLAARKRELCHRIFEADRQALMEYLLAANLKIQDNDRQQTNFLARALRDLRAPLTALHGYCGLLADGQLGTASAEQRELFRRMQSSARRLIRQTSGIFDLAIPGNVSRQPQCEPSDIDDVVSQALHEIYPLLQDKNQRITVQLAPAGETFSFDPEQVTQVVMNLLENCAKFTPPEGLIEIRGYNVELKFEAGAPLRHSIRTDVANTNAYQIDIQDNSPGIQPQLISAIFDQYTSYAGGRDRSGGGLGLAICKMIVTAHRGLIWADSSPSGVSFSFVLPFEPFSLQSQELANLPVSLTVN